MKTLRNQLWDAQAGQCWYCGDVVGRDEDRILGPDGWPSWRPEVREPHIDHKHPRSRGGLDGDNLVLACAPCNIEKSSQTVDEYRERKTAEGWDETQFFGERVF